MRPIHAPMPASRRPATPSAASSSSTQLPAAPSSRVLAEQSRCLADLLGLGTGKDL